MASGIMYDMASVESRLSAEFLNAELIRDYAYRMAVYDRLTDSVCVASAAALTQQSARDTMDRMFKERKALSALLSPWESEDDTATKKQAASDEDKIKFLSIMEDTPFSSMKQAIAGLGAMVDAVRETSTRV